MISDEAVEAALIATSWVMEDLAVLHAREGIAVHMDLSRILREALEAAAPHMLAGAKAKVLEEAADVIEARARNLAGFYIGKEMSEAAKASWSAMRHEARTIRDRATAMRGGICHTPPVASEHAH